MADHTGAVDKPSTEGLAELLAAARTLADQVETLSLRLQRVECRLMSLGQPTSAPPQPPGQ
jgi:hypothetical protein